MRSAIVEAGRAGLDNEGGDAAGAGRFAGTGEDHIEVGNAAVGDEGLLAIDHVCRGPRPAPTVDMAATSEPASDSVSAKAAMAAPSATRGR